MKKLLYSLMTAAIALTGCTTWDEPTTENYGEGPSIDVSITAMAPTDSAFVVSIVPAEGSTYYAFVMDANDEAEELDAATLLKGGYGNSVVNTEKYPSLTIPVTKMQPNTTYQVYAVASNEKGIVGKIAVASIKTTDSGKPTFADFTANSSAKSATIIFNQAITRGEGKVSGIYYKEWDFGNPVTLTEEDITVAISGNKMVLSAEDVPAGAYLLFSWEEGTVVDAVGNKCAAYNSCVNEAAEGVEDIFLGVWMHVTNKNWSLTDANISSPKSGSTFPKWSEFVGEITFEDAVYVDEEEVKDGDFMVTYTNDSRTATYKVPVKNINFGLDENAGTKKVTFTLPAATQPGDKVSLAIAEGVFKDVYGNENSAFTSKVYWISFSMTKNDVLGTFTFYWQYSSNVYKLGNVTIEEYIGDDAEEGDVVIKDFYVPGNTIYGYYVLDDCKLYIYSGQKLGILNDPEEGDYGNLLQSSSGSKVIAFDVTTNGIVSSDLRVMGTNPEYTEGWWWEIPAGGNAIFVKANVAAIKASKRSQAIAKSRKGLPKSIQLYRK